MILPSAYLSAAVVILVEALMRASSSLVMIMACSCLSPLATSFLKSRSSAVVTIVGAALVLSAFLAIQKLQKEDIRGKKIVRFASKPTYD